MTTIIKILANCMAALAVLGIVYLANPGFKAFADTKYLAWAKEREIRRFEQAERDGKIKILVPTDQL